MQLFGSDGFRSEFGSNFMTLECLYKFIQALSSWVKYSSLNKPVMIAMDTRSSGLVVRNLFVSVLTYRGIDVLDVGVVPSPGISKLLALNDAALGIMITASHNPWKDNGVKLFSSEGKKFRSEWEANIEERLKSQKFSAEPSKRLGQVFYLRNAFKIYVDSVLLGQRLETGGSKVLIDCANGAFSQLKEAIDGNSRIGFSSWGKRHMKNL